MTINGYTVDIDVTDADFIERMEKANDNLNNEIERLKETVKDENFNIAEGIRQECKIIKDFFDYVLGDGTSEKIFNGKDSLNLCFQAYEELVKASEEQYKILNDKISAYSPDRLVR